MTQPPEIPPDSDETAKYRHILPSTTSSTLTTTLRPLLPFLTPLLTHISYIDRAVTSTAQKKLSESDTNTDTTATPTCNLRSQDWETDVVSYFANRGWGDVDLACVSSVLGAGAEDGVSIDGSTDRGVASRVVYDAVLAAARMENNLTQRVVRMTGVAGWEKAVRATGFVHSVRTQECSLDHAAFIRRGEKWYVSVRYTNVDKSLTRAPGDRKFLYTYVRPRGEELEDVEMTTRVDGEADAWRDDSVVVEYESQGDVSASEFGDVFEPENDAVMRSLRNGEHQTQQASDATTPSNIAILALPLAMNLVPVALIADVNNWGMLVYTLLTDVLTTVPLAIKGVEVLLIGNQAKVAVVTRITGGNLGRQGNKAAEVWVAECRATGSYQATGIVLLVVALAFMIGGVVAEMWARKWVRGRGGFKVVGDEEMDLDGGVSGSASSGVFGEAGVVTGGMGGGHAAALVMAGGGVRDMETRRRKS